MSSSTVGAVSNSKNMGFDVEKEVGEKSGVEESGDERVGNVKRSMSEEASFCATEDDDEDEDEEGRSKIQLGPQYTLKEQLEKDKDDESLRRWKEQLLGSVDVSNVGEALEPEVKILSLSILSPNRPEIVLPIPEDGNPKGLWFTLKEVDSTKEMLGTFSPQQEHYTHVIPEETTPSGFFARGSYSARSKFVDDDNKCYLEIHYTFDIQKDWATP
ncbi:rho GDP-dissociation inhibitor 1-like isoform X2 [Rhododendron vialii]|uniref:rho GDP-dissociation inhibitor 1-like isoform X2 n=1 Tax=Rhododendron vialii TaxID=182163 RepID=UPI00265F1EF2|nr:rho GDP-dissociation inhibitor 1-like isoform X2 [Rhododendron vialii]